MTGIFLLIYKKNLCSTAISSDLSLVFLLVSYFVFQVKMTSSFAFMTKTYLMINIFHLCSKPLSSDKLFFDSIRYRYDMRVFFSIRYDTI